MMRPPFEIVTICAAARDWILDGDLQLQLYPSSRLFLFASWSVSLDGFVGCLLVGSPGGYQSWILALFLFVLFASLLIRWREKKV